MAVAAAVSPKPATVSRPMAISGMYYTNTYTLYIAETHQNCCSGNDDCAPVTDVDWQVNDCGRGVTLSMSFLSVTEGTQKFPRSLCFDPCSEFTVFQHGEQYMAVRRIDCECSSAVHVRQGSRNKPPPPTLWTALR